VVTAKVVLKARDMVYRLDGVKPPPQRGHSATHVAGRRGRARRRAERGLCTRGATGTSRTTCWASGASA